MGGQKHEETEETEALEKGDKIGTLVVAHGQLQMVQGAAMAKKYTQRMEELRRRKEAAKARREGEQESQAERRAQRG